MSLSLEVDGRYRTKVTQHPSLAEELATYDAQDRQETRGGLSYTYLADGRLHEKKSGATVLATYTIDEYGRLRKYVDSQNTVEYALDPAGRRIARKLNGGTWDNRMVYRGNRVVAEVDSAGQSANKGRIVLFLYVWRQAFRGFFFTRSHFVVCGKAPIVAL